LGHEIPNGSGMTLRDRRPKQRARKEPKRPVTLTPEEREMNRQAEASLDRKEAERRAGRDVRLPGEPELPGVEEQIKVEARR
jgi:hypothetical protein